MQDSKFMTRANDTVERGRCQHSADYGYFAKKKMFAGHGIVEDNPVATKSWVFFRQVSQVDGSRPSQKRISRLLTDLAKPFLKQFFWNSAKI